MNLLAVQGTLKSLLQHHSSKASILRCSVFFTVQLSHPYMTTGKTIALNRLTFVGKIMSLFFNMLSRLVMWRMKWQPTAVFLPRESCGQRSLVGCCSWDRTVGHDRSGLACMHALKEEMATHSSILAWRIPGTAEPGWLPSMGLRRVGHP